MSILGNLEKRAESRGEQLRKLPLADIQPNEKNFYGLRDVEELAENILAVGLLQPLVVEPAPAGSERPWKLLTGGRRYAAMVANLKKGGPAEAVCMVQEPADEAEELLQLISTNQYRKVTYWEKLQGVMALTKAVEAKKAEGVQVWHGVDLHKATVKQAVVKLSGLSRAEASKYGTIAEKLVPELLPFVEGDRMPFTVAYDVCQLPEWAQRELAKENTDRKGMRLINNLCCDLKLAEVRQGCEEAAVGELMLAVGRYMDPEATPFENQEQLKALKPSGYVGKVTFHWNENGVVDITGLEKDGMEAIKLGSYRLCQIAKEKYSDRMTSDWWQAEQAEKERKKEQEEKAAAEKAAKRRAKEQAAPCLCQTCTCTGCHEKCFGHCTGCGEKQTECNSYQNDGEKFRRMETSPAASAEPNGVQVEREAGLDEMQQPSQEDSSAAPQNDGEKKTPGGWVNVTGSAGPWPEHECLCAVRKYHRGGYSYGVALWRPELKEWCASELVDGKPVPLVMDVRRWYELPPIPEGCR